ncbi:hypothetical protein CWE09_13845 [Aliidiomarina minuta]|uniref:TolC family protein n=1 Tax=Aliidiomarina minuta TaxID=880057 RepID=A0A432W1A9_9GAMM|nr:efflux transporter outer membrane subunit [Aliidiomarina minuta]RUO23009.1 hypothetical protein CWE09_13845 [Aliidiomarina minuta]
MRNFKAAGLLFSLLSLTACATVGPDYAQPEQVADIDFSSPYEQPQDVLKWWQAFADPHLDALIDITLQNNRTLASASANVERAYAVFTDVDNDFMPDLGLETGYQANRNALFAGGDQVLRGYQSGARLSWDLDLTGKLRRASEAAAAQADYAEILWHDAQLQLVSQVATSYGEYRGAQLRLLVAQENLQNLRQSQDIIIARYEAGMASELEKARFAAQVHEVEALVPDFELALLTAELTLSALSGQRPEQLELGEVAMLPGLQGPVAIANGENYLRYRADVASAERLLAARTAEIGVVTADLYPNLSLNGFLGFASTPGLSLGSEQRSWAVAPTLSWQVAELSSVRSRIQAANASQRMALAEFEQSVFDAIADMQLSLHSYNLSRQQQLALEQQWSAGNNAVSLARARYQAGGAEFLELLESERELLRSSDRLAQVEQQNFARLIDIYRSFGGGIKLL